MIHTYRTIPISQKEHDKWNMINKKEFPFVYKECDNEYVVYTDTHILATFSNIKDALLFAHSKRTQFFNRFQYDGNFVKDYWNRLKCNTPEEKMYYSLDLIYSIAFGYDGFTEADDLKGLIDDLSEIAVYTMKNFNPTNDNTNEKIKEK